MQRPRVELAIFRSQVRCPNHHTTEPPSQILFKLTNGMHVNSVIWRITIQIQFDDDARGNDNVDYEPMAMLYV